MNHVAPTTTSDLDGQSEPMHGSLEQESHIHPALDGAR